MNCLFWSSHAALQKSRPHTIRLEPDTVAAQSGCFLDENGLAVNRVMTLFRAGNDVLGFFHLVRCSVDDKHVLVGLQGDIVL